jgi:serine/threonine protein kinase
VVKNTKEYFDQSLDEIKLLTYLNARAQALDDLLPASVGEGDRASPDVADEVDEDLAVRSLETPRDVVVAVAQAGRKRVLQLVDSMYYKEHLFLVTELLHENLYELQRLVSRLSLPRYFTIERIQRIAQQVLEALAFAHGLGILHCDLKPENILVASHRDCAVKVIDFGSSCFVTDHLTSYIQSRSYRAPEVVLGLPYGPKIDVWSLGCILCELLTGDVLFVNDTVPIILARMQSILGPIPTDMLDRGRETAKFFTPDYSAVYEEAADVEDGAPAGSVLVLRPRRLSLREHLGPHLCGDAELASFLECLLQVDPANRPSAVQALQHPFLRKRFDHEPYGVDPAVLRRARAELPPDEEEDEGDDEGDDEDEDEDQHKGGPRRRGGAAEGPEEDGGGDLDPSMYDDEYGMADDADLVGDDDGQLQLGADDDFEDS